MTIMMNLEIEESLHLSDVMKNLALFSSNCHMGKEVVVGNFDLSNVYFVFSESDEEKHVFAEGVNVGWEVGIRGVFHCPINTLTESWIEIKNFLCAISRSCNNNFILSFQYEEIYAIGGGGNIKFLAEMVY